VSVGVNVGVSRVTVGVAVVTRIGVNPRIELVEHVRLMRSDSLVILHLLRLWVNSRVCHIGSVARMGTQGVRCRAGRAIVFPRAIWARPRAVQRSVGVGGSVRVRLATAEVGVTGRGAKGSSSRGAISGSVAARADSVCELAVASTHSTVAAVVRVDSGIGFVGNVRGVRCSA